jgi:hypothetical protein
MSGSSALSAAGGIQAWLRVLDRSATAISSAAPAAAGDPTNGLADGMLDGMLGLQLAATGIRANVAVLKTSDEMLGSLLDLHA